MQLWDVVETLQVLKHLWLLLSHYVHKTDSCPHNGNIRLVGPSGPNTVEGRVEYCSNGVWGTIRSSGFDTRDGEVVCRQLGHQHPRELIKFSVSSKKLKAMFCHKNSM